MNNPNEILKLLLQNEVDFILIGGLAAVTYGVSTVTQDIDVCFSFEPQNIQKLLTALKDIHPRVRAGSGFFLLESYTAERLTQLDNLYMKTDLGALDLIGQVVGLGNYQQLKNSSTAFSLFGFTCQLLEIEALIKSKQIANRPKDQPVILELQAIQEKMKKKSCLPQKP